MNCLRLRRIGKFIYLFDDKYNFLVSSGFFSSKKYYSVNQPSLRTKFLNYLMPESNLSKISIDKQISDNHYENKINNCTDNNTKLIDTHVENLWKKQLNKNIVMSILQKTNPLELKNFLRIIDTHCCRLINNLSFSEIFQLLNFLMKIDDSKIAHIKFYKNAIKILKVALKRDQLNTHEIFMLLFFASLQKKQGSKDVIYIKHCLPSFNKLSLVKKCILADALFKCSIKLHKFEETSIEEVIESNAEFLVKEKHLLVPLCKVIRHVGPSKNFTSENLNHALMNSSDKFDLTFCAHVLSLYAEALLKADNVLIKLFNNAFEYLGQNQKARVKDIDKLLWSAATLNYRLVDQDFDEIDKCIKRNFSIFKAEYIKLMNIFLSSWMLQYQQKELIHKCFEEQIFNPIVQNTEDWKSRTKLQLLISCIKIEAPDIEIPLELVESYDLQIQIRKNLKKIFKEIQGMRHDFNLIDLVITNPIKGIYIPSICMKYNNDKIAYIDVLDEYNCLKNSNEPHGFMNLKLRLLSNVGYQSIMMTKEYGDDSKKLNEYLQKKLM